MVNEGKDYLPWLFAVSFTIAFVLLAFVLLALFVMVVALTHEPTTDELQRSTVLIQYRYAGETKPAGSGVVTDRGILTAGHVALAAPADGQLLVTYHDGTTVTASVVKSTYTGTDERIHRDLALLSPASVHAEAVGITCERPSVGDEVTVIGHPSRLRWAVSEGSVMTDRAPAGYPEGAWIATDAMIWRGSSGAPVFNESGEVLGIVASASGTTLGGATGSALFSTPEAMCGFLDKGP